VFYDTLSKQPSRSYPLLTPRAQAQAVNSTAPENTSEFWRAGTLVPLFCLGGAKAIKENQVNEEIRDKEVRVVDFDGTQLGIMSIEQAIQLSNDRKLDLVNVAPTATPPVCRIMDYGKYRYDQQKKEKEARKRQKTIEVKEIRLSTFIEDHDLMVKANNAIKFLKEGDKVKVSLRFRGREKDRVEAGQTVMAKFGEAVSTVGSIEKPATFEGRSLIMIVAPKND